MLYSSTEQSYKSEHEESYDSTIMPIMTGNIPIDVSVENKLGVWKEYWLTNVPRMVVHYRKKNETK